MSDFTIPILIFIDGFISILLAFWAHEIGLDPDTTWGQTRFFLLFFGLVFCLISIFLGLSTKSKDKFFAPIRKSETARILFSLGHIWLLVILIYIWFITYANWTTWNHTTSYYDQLAKAFAHGQLNIDIDPGAALLAAPNPYDLTHRPAFNSEIWDMSLYKDKIYLYWGPLPAILIAPLKFFLDKKITDNMLVFLFFSGLLIFNSLILLKLWKKFFKTISEWYLFSCVILTGLMLPILWSLNSPRVYEAAIGGGQIFLMGGIFFALSAFDHETKIDRTRLFIAGLFWVCSVASRAINALSVVFFVGLIIFWLIRKVPKDAPWTSSIPEIAALLIPLAAGGLGVIWYNWVRFDSPFEFGFRYAISILDLNKQSNLVFQPSYLFANLYAYVFQPFELTLKFPFITPLVPASKILTGLGVAPSSIYFVGRMTGLLFCAPFLLFGFVHLLPAFRFTREKDVTDSLLAYDFVIYLLAGSFTIVFLSLMFFFFGQMRYLVDVISLITLLGIMGYWRTISISQASPTAQFKILLGFANLLMIFTICASLLLAFSSDYDRLKTLNPIWFEKISNSLNIQK